LKRQGKTQKTLESKKNSRNDESHRATNIKPCQGCDDLMVLKFSAAMPGRETKVAVGNFRSKIHFQTTAGLSRICMPCRKSNNVRHAKMARLSHSPAIQPIDEFTGNCLGLSL